MLIGLLPELYLGRGFHCTSEDVKIAVVRVLYTFANSLETGNSQIRPHRIDMIDCELSPNEELI